MSMCSYCLSLCIVQVGALDHLRAADQLKPSASNNAFPPTHELLVLLNFAIDRLDLSSSSVAIFTFIFQLKKELVRKLG